MSDTSQQDTNITIADLQNVLVLIDLATQRGSFRGHELASVGGLYNKIDTFVKNTQKQQENSQATKE
jgi:hypothetical protein